jgi:chorismate-pyruvate lyase
MLIKNARRHARQNLVTNGSQPLLTSLAATFYVDQAQLGQFEEVTPESMPEPYRTLLSHRQHMTVTVERFHGSPVDVVVLATATRERHYARKILLTRHSDGAVVQFGIMRINFDYLSDAVRREVESQSTPLGRILIQHDVLREIHLVRLWCVTPGTELAAHLGMHSGDVTYGRTAIIHCNGEPAVELLEIVAPAAGP